MRPYRQDELATIEKFQRAAEDRRRESAMHGSMDTAVTLALANGWDAATTVAAAEQFYAYLIKDRTDGHQA